MYINKKNCLKKVTILYVVSNYCAKGEKLESCQRLINVTLLLNLQ